MIAIGAIAAAREHGFDTPSDVAVTGYGNIDAAEMAVPPLTPVEALTFEQGRAAARLLLERMTNVYSKPSPPPHLVSKARGPSIRLILQPCIGLRFADGKSLAEAEAWTAPSDGRRRSGWRRCSDERICAGRPGTMSGVCRVR